MSASPSLYRRHRPRTFADVVGQEHVVRTLSHAVEQGNIHHAYLFVGSRGTGKTSMAKILAACLNCEHGPTISPCGVCDSCVAIANATSLDVIEMDAASNNSVDDIRELRDKVAYAPVSGRHKVYILDEAHMLSTQAWNAFLKTLEEPPPRTVFVLATTEARKVLPTVVDRCHRFDFGRPSAEQVAEVLRRVSVAESIDIDDGAMALIARNATGSFRDALGTLEQLLTYSGGARIEPADVLAVLGVADLDQLAAAVDAVTAGDPASALRAAASLTAAGRDPAQILRDLEGHVNDLLTVQIMGAVPEQVRVTPDRDAALLAQAQRLSPAEATRLLELVVAALGASNAGAQPRIQLELALVKAAAPEVDPSLSALMTRLQRLERSGAPVAAAPVVVAPVAPAANASVAPSATSATAPPTADTASTALTEPTPEPAADATAAPVATSAPAPSAADSTESPVEAAPEPPAQTAPATDATGAPSATSAPAPSATGAADASVGDEDDFWDGFDATPWPEEAEPSAPSVAATPTTPPAAKPASPTPAAAKPAHAPTPAPAAAKTPAAVPEADGAGALVEDRAAAPSASGASFDLAQFRSVWPAVVDRVRASNAMLAVLLDGAQPNALEGGTLALAWPPANDFYRRKAEREEYRRVAINAIRDVTGMTLNVDYLLADSTPQATPAGVAAEPVKLSEDEVVQRFIDDFGASEIPDPDEQDS